MATVEIATGAGAAGWRLAAQALRSQVGGARRLGLVCWGDAGAWPVGNALDDGLGDALGAIVLLDRVDLPQGARPSVLCHLARRRSPAEQRAIARRLAALERAGTPMLVHWYDAAPGFAAPELAAPELAAPGLPALGGAAPGLAAADRDRLGRDGGLAWRRTVTFLARHLDPSTAGRTPTIG